MYNVLDLNTEKPTGRTKKKAPGNRVRLILNIWKIFSDQKTEKV